MSNFNEILQFLNLKTISSASVGGGAGSIIKLELETSDFIFIYCAWRLEHAEVVLSTSEDDSLPLTGLMSSTIKKLENKRINKIELTSQYDLIIFFENNYVFKVFCNISYSNDGYSNWELCSPQRNIVYTVNNEFKIDITSYF